VPVFDYVLRDRLAAGETVYTIWSSIPDVGMIEALSEGAMSAVTLDMQHGGHHEQSVLGGLPAIIRGGKAAVVRVPVGRFDMASRALDMGADAVIAPMINSIEEATEFRDAMKYPPLGKRSWGITRTQNVRGIAGGTEYLKTANDRTVSFAMIETRAAFDIADEIAAIEGIDALFVGPADFSIAWTRGETVDALLADMDDAVARIAEAARKAGKYAGIFCISPEAAQRYRDMGFQFIALAIDAALVVEGQKSILAAAEKT
jgi:4-hydroxy-2-oxoheptanedioate aldolase